jgi:hypothetical protein
LALLLLVFNTANAAPASSTNYSITHDVLSGGGGESSSANYQVRTAAGQSSAIGESASSNYAVNAGFHAIQAGGPTITGVWPGNVPTGQTISVFVFGSGFDPAPGATEVYFNGVRQYIVQVVTEDMLIARVFVTTSLFGPVMVKTPAGGALSSIDFGIPITGLQITGVWPGVVHAGVPVSVFVFGNEFDLAPGATEVYFNGVRQFIVQVVTPDMLIVRTTPTLALSGPVTVKTPGGGTAVSGTNLVVVP